MYACSSSIPGGGSRCNGVRENPGKAGITRFKLLYEGNMNSLDWNDGME